MAYGHSSSGHLSLDGVQFKLSEVFTSKPKVLFAGDFDIKDPDVLLEDLQYNFELEEELLAEIKRKQQEDDEKRRLEQEQREREKKELEEKHRQFMLEKQKEAELKEQLEKVKEDEKHQEARARKLSPSNPFFNDLMGKDILKPQPASPDKGLSGTKQSTTVNIHEFETEAPDPFSDMELKTIDDLEELKDVLQIVSSNSGKQSPDEAGSTSNGIICTETISPVNGLSHKPPDAETKKKSMIIDQLTDFLTDDVKAVDDPQASPLAMPRAKKNKNVVPQHPTQNPPGFLPPITASQKISGSSSPTSSKGLMTTTVSNFNTHVDTAGQTTYIQNINNFTRSSNVSSSRQVPVSSPAQTKTENIYENIPSQITPPPVKPRIAPRKVTKPVPDKASSNNIKEPNPNSYGAVKNKVLANKSATERAKFEDTINKALTSLPQLPIRNSKPLPLEANDQQSVEEQIKPRSTSQTPSPQPLSPGLLSGLSENEREFAQSFTSMGFKEQDVVRTMEKHGTDHKEVIEHLIVLQRLVEQRFGMKNIEEALDIFNGDEKEAVKFLQLERLFIDMGFSSEKIKEALLLTDRNQEKALGILMGES